MAAVEVWANASARFFGHQPKKPFRPRPVPKRGRAAGSGVAAKTFHSALPRSEKRDSNELPSSCARWAVEDSSEQPTAREGPRSYIQRSASVKAYVRKRVNGI